MGWIIALVVVAFVIYKFNGNGKKRWKLTIAHIVSTTFPSTIADAVRMLVNVNKDKDGYSAKVFLTFMSNFIVNEAKGEQSGEATERDARNVLCIVHGDEELKRLFYDKYREYAAMLPEEYAASRTVSYDEFGALLADIRFK